MQLGLWFLWKLCRLLRFELNNELTLIICMRWSCWCENTCGALRGVRGCMDLRLDFRCLNFQQTLDIFEFCLFFWLPDFAASLLTLNLNQKVYGYVLLSFLRIHHFGERSGKRTFIFFRLFVYSIQMSFQSNRWISRAKPKHIHIVFYCICFCYTEINSYSRSASALSSSLKLNLSYEQKMAQFGRMLFESFLLGEIKFCSMH